MADPANNARTTPEMMDNFIESPPP